MTTSPISSLSKPEDARRIEPWELAYFQARNRGRAHDLVLREFQKSGISQADLARRLNKRPEVISRLLGAPGNWGIDTISDLLFAISGAEPVWESQYPLDAPARNYRYPDWLGMSQSQVSSGLGAYVRVVDPGSLSPDTTTSSVVRTSIRRID